MHGAGGRTRASSVAADLNDRRKLLQIAQPMKTWYDRTTRMYCCTDANDCAVREYQAPKGGLTYQHRQALRPPALRRLFRFRCSCEQRAMR